MNFFSKFLNSYRKKNAELVQSCLNSLNTPNIKTLDLGFDIQLNDEELQNLFKCYQCTNDKSEDQIATLTDVISFDVSGCNKLTDQVMGHIAKLNNQTHLNLIFCRNQTDQAMGHLATLTNLTNLDVSGCKELTYQADQSDKGSTFLEKHHYRHS